MRLLHGGDFHLGLTRHSSPGTTSRADDLAATLMRFADAAIKFKAQIAILAGDTFHSRRPPPRDLHSLTQALRRLREGGVTTLITSGNHDGPDTVGDPRTNALAWMTELDIHGVHALTAPYSGLFQYGIADHIGLVSLPYPHKRSFDALMPDLDPDARTEEISRRLEAAIEALYDKVAGDVGSTTPILFIGHLTTVGAVLGTEVSMRFGWDVAIRASVLDRFDYAALGHIHRQQQASRSAWYAGSPEYMDFGEEGQQKGFLLVDVERGRDPVVKVIDSEARPMKTLDVYPENDGWRGLPENYEGHMLRVRVHLTEGGEGTQSDVVRLVRLLRDGGAAHVQSEVITPERDRVVRVPVDPNVEAAEALKRWLVANGHPLEPHLAVGIELINRVGARDG